MSDAFIKLTYEHGEQYINASEIKTVDIFKEARTHFDLVTHEDKDAWGYVRMKDDNKEYRIENPDDIQMIRVVLDYVLVFSGDTGEIKRL